MKKQVVLFNIRYFLAFLFLIFSVSVSDCQAATYVVPDQYSTIQAAVNVAGDGDVVRVRNGTYREVVSISRSNFTLEAYPGHTPVIDGQNNSLPGSEDGILVNVGGTNNTVRGFEIRYSSGRGVGVSGSNNKVYDLNVHHNWKSAILITGSNNLAEGCTVWENSIRTDYPSTSACLTVCCDGRNNVIRNNTVYHNHGEALSCFRDSRGTVIEDNVLYDNEVENIYVDNCPETIIRRNLIYYTGYTGSGERQWREAPGIELRDERSDGLRSENLIIVNNMVYGTNKCFNSTFYSEYLGLKGALIAYNTFVNASSGVNFRIKSGPTFENNTITNNIIAQDGSSSFVSVPSSSQLSFSHNLWSRTPASSASGPGDIIGDPELAKTGSVSPGALTAEWFKLLSQSPARDRARVISEVQEDFFGSLRGSSPDIGAHEYGGSSPLPTPSTSPVPTLNPTPELTPTPQLLIPGDLSGDGNVDIFDLVLVGSHFGQSTGVPCSLDPCPDADGDGDVDIFDLVIVGSNFGSTG